MVAKILIQLIKMWYLSYCHWKLLSLENSLNIYWAAAWCIGDAKTSWFSGGERHRNKSFHVMWLIMNRGQCNLIKEYWEMSNTISYGWCQTIPTEQAKERNYYLRP